MEHVSRSKLARPEFAVVPCDMHQPHGSRESFGIRQDLPSRSPQEELSPTAMHAPLKALASELSAAQETALDLQISISSILTSLGDASCDAIFSLQDVDRLAQILGDLSTFAQALAVSSPETWHVDVHFAASRLNLRDLAHRLCGDEVIPAESLAPADEDNDCTFF
jgi:hypothetical protein